MYNTSVTFTVLSNYLSLHLKTLETDIAERTKFRIPMAINYIQRCHRNPYLLNHSKSPNPPFGRQEQTFSSKQLMYSHSNVIDTKEIEKWFKEINNLLNTTESITTLKFPKFLSQFIFNSKLIISVAQHLFTSDVQESL